MLHLVRLFLIEEVRLRRSFSSALSLIIFPELVLLGSLTIYLFSPLLEGSISYHDIYAASLGALFMFGISMGGIAFLGKEFLERSLGPVTMLSASVSYQPVSDRKMYLSYFLHDLLFYVALVLAPMSAGLAIGTIARPAPVEEAIILTLAQWSSFLLGLSASMFVSAALNNRKRRSLLLIPLSIVPFLACQYFSGKVEGFIPSIMLANTGDLVWLVPSLSLSLAFIAGGTAVFDGAPRESGKGSFGSYKAAYLLSGLIYRDDPVKRAVMARDFMSLLRGRAYVRVGFSMVFPLAVLGGMLGLIGRFQGADLEFNLTFFSVMVSFFTISIYSHIVNLDHLEFDQTLPLDAPSLIRVRIREHLLISLPLSFAFLVGMALVTGDLKGLLVSIPLLLVSVPYMAHVTAYLTGLWTNSLLFDSSVFIRYIVFTVLPLMFSTMLSLLMEQVLVPSLIGIALVLIMGVVAIRVLRRNLDRQWRDALLSSAGSL